eukprot:CAMPEP_0204914018 /NCGR_PEP_ID=MMETSP1397-20131031/11878_1 /ASSEMBLY_ACC=CAM_ASM_000891 /TAXON_ID=49980 /ORGANISM="Climacostomum Climacostomum virens, Strain Stock W-24" /LENGTH=356 /DNA_ID=CAMNT_0052085413 /DNA_START=827 /DNA_END=1897 /DNA_ORIENTATION=+
MRTLDPSELLSTSDFPRTYSCSFPPFSEVQQYLRDYSAHFNLEPLINYNTAVVCVEPLSLAEYEVTVRNASGIQEKQIFSKVVVANGHFSVPFIPDIPGLSTFEGAIHHSHNIKRTPSQAEYQDRRVAVVGCYASAWDKIRALAKAQCAKIVISASRSGRGFYGMISDAKFTDLIAQDKIKIVSPVERVAGNTFFTEDSCFEVDEVIFCTGYHYSFPFLPHQKVSDNGQYPDNLALGIFDTEYPGIVHIGNMRGLAFIQADIIARYLKVAMLEETDTLKLKQKLAEEEERAMMFGIRKRELLKSRFLSLQGIIRSLEEFRLEADPVWMDRFKRVYAAFSQQLITNFMNYKESNLII